ncbi:hypothetical protein ACFXO7_38360, partial [Nocardia tengchongensis]|uniref:hypothetical protein n=1 Tax=Nocardia tengchongensis TaxID=2055889 RepID=UPI003674DAE1
MADVDSIGIATEDPHNSRQSVREFHSAQNISRQKQAYWTIAHVRIVFFYRAIDIGRTLPSANRAPNAENPGT